MKDFALARRLPRISHSELGIWWHAVAQLVEALRYKPEDRGFDSRWCHNPSGRTMAQGYTQPLT
jgi:hypothetical protein